MKYIIITILLSGFITAKAQENAFDFWIGTWDLTWTDAEGNTKKGINIIERTMNEKIIQENFSTLDEAPENRYKGKSWSVYNPITKTWNQTWVDNGGGYLDFEGEILEDKRFFKRSFLAKNGNTIYQRMVFFDIEKDSFSWKWESSTDRENWKVNWSIKYRRK